MPASPDLLNLGRRGTKALARCVADNVDDSVRIKCATVLGRIGDRSALPALQGALEAWNPWVRTAAIRAVRSMPDASSVDPLIRIVQREDEELPNRALALEVLGSMSDQKAVKALLAQIPNVREARMLNNIAFALERLDPKAFYAAIPALVGHKQAMIRMNAAFVLGDVRRPEGLPLLEKALADPNDCVRVSAVAAIGKLDAPEATKILEPLVSDKNSTLRITAIESIFALSDGERNDLVYDKLYAPTDVKPPLKLAAALMLVRANDPRVVDSIVACVELQTCPLPLVDDYLRAMTTKEPSIPARMMLQCAKGRLELTTLVAEMKPAGVGPLAVGEIESALAARNLYDAGYAIDLAGAVNEPSAATVLPKLLQHESARVRVHAAVALIREDAPTAADAATQLWKDFDAISADRLPALAHIFGTITEPKARARLDAELKKRESALLAARRLDEAETNSRIALSLEPGVDRVRALLDRIAEAKMDEATSSAF